MINKNTYNSFLNQSATEYSKQFSKTFTNNGSIQIYMSICLESRRTARSHWWRRWRCALIQRLEITECYLTLFKICSWMLDKTFMAMHLFTFCSLFSVAMSVFAWVNKLRQALKQTQVLLYRHLNGKRSLGNTKPCQIKSIVFFQTQSNKIFLLNNTSSWVRNTIHVIRVFKIYKNINIFVQKLFYTQHIFQANM